MGFDNKENGRKCQQKIIHGKCQANVNFYLIQLLIPSLLQLTLSIYDHTLYNGEGS